MNEEKVIIEIGDKTLELSTGKLAKQANGSVLGKLGGSSVLSTVCCSTDINPQLDFIPLQVEYNEKYYAAGKIPGGFLKREGRPKDKEILVSRLIDRPMRPLFSKEFMREIQLIPTVISTDTIHPPDVIAMCAASACVFISDIPFDGPVGAVRIVKVNGNHVVNPTFEEIDRAELEIIVSGSLEGITMVEGGGKEVSEEDLIDAIEFAKPCIQSICEAQVELAKKVGKEKLDLVAIDKYEDESKVKASVNDLLTEACFILGKSKRSEAIKKIRNDYIARLEEERGEEIDDDEKKVISGLIHDLEKDIVRSSILNNKRRTDHRTPTDIRPIACEVEVVPHTHGTGLFTRGETQALAFVTLGTAMDAQIRDDIDGDRKEHFMLHYNFPPYSVGETGRLFTGRREIGHGHLAFRSVEPILPSKEEFPYTLRIVSEVLESNGSSSMATVCGSSLSLMDAGVPIKKAVAGIAMGLVYEDERSYEVISDILGEEDHLGDMDFKVAGTKDGITGFQMDIKIKNISSEIMKHALSQAKEGRLHILSEMNKCITSPKEALSPHAPRILSFNVDPDKIGILIGSGGKTIKSITEKYNVQADINDSGLVTIYGKESQAADEALKTFQQLLEEPEVGKEYDGVVKRITDFGAFIEIIPGKDGLCHISQISKQRVNKVEDYLQLNQTIRVKIIEIDRLGRVNLALVNLIDKKR